MADATIGMSLRALRNQTGTSLRELGRMTGMSAAYLVSIEKGNSSPTIATLSKVLRALGTDLATFFANASTAPEVPVFDGKSMHSVCDKTREYTFLLPKRNDMRFEMVCETILPEKQNSEWEIHDCDIGGYILSGGPAVLEIEGVGQWPLKKGDAFYIKARQKHRLVNNGSKVLKQITVMDPPRY